MPKFYVRCGSLQVVIIANNAKQAATKAVLFATKDSKLCNTIRVNETGFCANKDVKFDLTKILKLAGFTFE